MNWLQTWKDVSDKNSFLWNKGFRLLELKNGRSLFAGEASSTPSLPNHYTVLVQAGSNGLEISASLGTKTFSLGIGSEA